MHEGQGRAKVKKKRSTEEVDRESFVAKFGEEPPEEEAAVAWETGLHLWLLARKALREEQWKEHK